LPEQASTSGDALTAFELRLIALELRSIAPGDALTAHEREETPSSVEGTPTERELSSFELRLIALELRSIAPEVAGTPTERERLPSGAEGIPKGCEGTASAQMEAA
jgi:hypothetical protein